VTRKNAAPEKPVVTLTDADIISQRSVTRRSLLGVLGLSAGAAATVAFGTIDSAPAADSDSKKKTTKKPPPKKPKPADDND